MERKGQRKGRGGERRDGMDKEGIYIALQKSGMIIIITEKR